MKWVTLTMGLALAVLLPMVAGADKNEPLTNGLAAQLVGNMIIVLTALHIDRE